MPGLGVVVVFIVVAFVAFIVVVVVVFIVLVIVIFIVVTVVVFIVVVVVRFIVVVVVFMVVAFVVFIVFVVAVFIVVVIAVWRIRKHLNLGFAGLKGHGRRFVSELVPGILTPPFPPPGNHPPNHSLGQIPQPLFALICVGGCMGEGGRKGGEGVCVGCGVRSCTAL